MFARVYNIHTTSRVFNDAPRAVDEIREDHEAKVPGVVLLGTLSPRMARRLQGCRCQLSAVFGCIRDVSSVLDDVLGVADKGPTVFDITQGI